MKNIFRNVMIWRVTQAVNLSVGTLNKALASKTYREPASQELSTFGFVPAIGNQGEMAEVIQPHTASVIRAMYAERQLPSAAVKDEVALRVRKIEEDQMRKVYSKEKAQIKDEVVQAFLPRAFIKRGSIMAIVAFPYIFIDTSSAKRAENLLSVLRDALGSLPVRPVTSKTSPIEVFTHWAIGDLEPDSFWLGNSFVAKGTSEEARVVSGRNVDLGSDEIQEMIRAKLRVTELALHHEDTDTPLVVTEMLGLKGIEWAEDLQDRVAQHLGSQEDDKQAVAAAEALRVTLIVLYPYLKDIFNDLLDAFGGEEVPQDVLDQTSEDQDDNLI